MARPPLLIGSSGEVWTTTRPRQGGVSHVALTRVRDPDGVTRQVSRSGRTAREAKANLRAHLAERAPAQVGVLTAATRLHEVAQDWQAQLEADVKAGRRSSSTLARHLSTLRVHVLPRVGRLQLRELTVPRCQTLLDSVAADHSESTQLAVKSALGGILRYAVRRGAIPASPLREVSAATPRRAKPKALSVDEQRLLVARLRVDEVAVRGDFPDLVALMLATGCRIGELLALDWDQVDEGEDGATTELRIEATLLRVKGRGLVRDKPKSAAGHRVVELPGWAHELITERWLRVFNADVMESLRGPVFPSRVGWYRDPSNTLHAWREVCDRVGFPGLKLHTLRKTTVTNLLQSGAEARDVADRVGHSRVSMTLDHYAGRGSAEGRRRTADLLEQVRPA